MPLSRRIRCSFLAGAASFLIPAFALAAAPPGSWVSLGPDGVGAILSIAVDPTSSSTIYAGTKGAGIFKSTDGSATFVAASSGLTNFTITAIAVNPSNPRIVYAATEGGVFRTDDGGASWSAAPGLPFAVFNGLALDPRNPATVFAVGDAGVFKSADSGSSWTAINSGLSGTSPRTIAV